MNDETYEALKNVVSGAMYYLNRKYGDRKRLSQDEVWENATLTRDIKQVVQWIDEVSKEYEPIDYTEGSGTTYGEHYLDIKRD